MLTASYILSLLGVGCLVVAMFSRRNWDKWLDAAALLMVAGAVCSVLAPAPLVP